jgi:hypothetical protein
MTLADDGKVPHFTFPFQVNAQRVTQLSNVSSPNVVGVLRGSDPALRDEYWSTPRTSTTSASAPR